MKSWLSRLTVSAALAAICWLLLAGAAATGSKSAPILEPNKLIILSTTDVKGKTSPCG